MHFSDALLKKIQEKKSVLCLGLDPHYEQIPESLKKGKNPGEVITSFLTKILDATHDLVAVVKPQLAFFEVFGSEGFVAFEQVCEYAKKKNLFVIVDGKRNDIGSTAEAYAEAYLGKNRPYDALTVTPYLGEDGIFPFIKKCEENEKGIFVLVKTSNPSGGEFQDLSVGDELLHEHIARKVALWGESCVGNLGFSSIGAVVGATYPDELRLLRQDMPEQILLIPGYGAQGGRAGDIAPAFYKDGKGAIVNSSRGILFAYKQEKAPEELFAECARKAAEKSKEELWEIVTRK
ncbi:orotidine-5'-phosphate decarboxylase [Candidatus Peregrinibacteria bacterium]|nr:orotidine-5'-phosphate decarboxylase [Candidatus Peregrinibacteria bacterium]